MMLKTRDQAAGMMCPVIAAKPRAAMRVCVGADCMAWNELPRRVPENGARLVVLAENRNAEDESEAGPVPFGCTGWKFIPCETEAAKWLEPEEVAAKRIRGYCGLAGRPVGVETAVMEIMLDRLPKKSREVLGL